MHRLPEGRIYRLFCCLPLRKIERRQRLFGKEGRKDCMNWNQILFRLELCLPGAVRNAEFLLRIFVAMVLGMLIGNERKNRNKAAGMRTHAMVALGAALMMVVSKYGFSDTAQGDGARLASQVVSGVGFLGAGMIFVRNNAVSGLTTAAGVWTTAGIGLTVGAGMYCVGILSAGLMVLMQNLSHRIPVFSNVTTEAMIRMCIRNSPGAVEGLEDFLESRKIGIQGIQFSKTEKETMKLEFEVTYPTGLDKCALFCALVEREEVLSAGE